MRITWILFFTYIAFAFGGSLLEQCESMGDIAPAAATDDWCNW